MRLALLVAVSGCRIGFDATPDARPRGADDGRGDGVLSVTEPASVSASNFHTCAIARAALSCWGANDQGQLGTGGAATNTPTPQSVPGSWREVAVGEQHTCAIDTADRVWCWGANGNGQLGVTGGPRTTPVQVALATSPKPVHIDTTYYHTCVLLADSSVSCWGRNIEGELGLDDGGTAPDAFAPTTPAIGPGFSDIAAAHAASVGIRSGTIFGTGRNTSDQLGLGPSGISQYRDFTQGADGPYVSIALGQNNGCAIRSDASLWCWGINFQYQLGTGDLVDHDVPVLIDDAHAWTDIDHDTFSACGIADGGKVLCWGRTIEGQLGIDTTSPVTTPMQTAPFDDVVRITAARFHSCLQRSDYSVWCAGENDFGMLGTGDFARRHAWTQVL